MNFLVLIWAFCAVINSTTAMNWMLLGNPVAAAVFFLLVVLNCCLAVLSWGRRSD